MSLMKGLVGVLFIVLAATSLIQLGIYWIAYGRLAFYRRKGDGQQNQPVSVIVCARNEILNLRKHLPAMLEQDYRSFEVIVVDDCSWDETGIWLEELSKQHSNLKVVTIKEQEKYRHGKKFALTLGIKAASHELLLMTDADCMPAGKNWVSLMQRNFSTEKEIVLGYGPYAKESGFINKLIRFDTFFCAMQYLSAALNGNAYMGVGRNLAYKKTVFFRSKGFAKHNHILSGDDDLFVNENATSTNTSIEIDPESYTYSIPKKKFSEWFSQKKRHMTTSRYYKGGHKTSLILQNGTSIIFYLLLVTLLIMRYEWRILISLYVVMLLARFPIIYKISNKLQEKDLAWFFPILDIFQSFLQPVFFTANILTKQKTWK